MIQIDLHKIDKKTWIIIALSLLFFTSLFKGCTQNKTLDLAKKEVNQSKEYSALHEKKAIELLMKNDSLEKAKEIAEEKINYLENKKQEEKIKILKLSKENILLKSSIEKYTTDDLVTFYAKRYNAPKEVFKTDLGIVFKDTLSKIVAKDLVDSDFTEKELDITRKVLHNEVAKSSIKDTIIINLENQKKNLNFAMNERALIIDNQYKLIDNQLKIIKKETRKKKFFKYSIPVTIGLGIIGGVLIAK